MIPYYIILLLLFFTAFLFKKNDRERAIVFIFAIFLLAIFAALRDKIGADYFSYVLEFEEIPTNLIKFFHYEGHSEFGFLLLCYLLKILKFSYYFLFFITSFGTSLLLYRACRTFSSGYLILNLCLYFSLFYLRFHFNIIRHGIMVSLLWVAFSFAYKKKLKAFLFFILIAAFFHSLSLFFIPFYWLLNRKYSNKFMVFALGGSIVFGFVIPIWDYVLEYTSGIIFSDKIAYYITDYYINVDNASAGITLGLFVNIFLLLFLKIYERQYSNIVAFPFLCNSLFFAILFSLLFNKYGVFVERIVSVFYVTVIFLLPPFLIGLSKNLKVRVLLLLLLLMYSFITLTKVLYSPNQFGNFQFIPYKTILS